MIPLKVRSEEHSPWPRPKHLKTSFNYKGLNGKQGTSEVGQLAFATEDKSPPTAHESPPAAWSNQPDPIRIPRLSRFTTHG